MPSRSYDVTRRSGPPRRPAADKHDPGAYIGRLPERVAESIPGGVGREDERVAAVATQPGPARGPAPAADRGDPPGGHREATADPENAARETGQAR